MTMNGGKKGKTTALAKREEVALIEQVAEMARKLEELMQSGRLAGEALLKLVNVGFDTPDRLLPELTEIPRAAVLPLSIQMMREQAIDRPIDPDTGKLMRLSKIWRICYMKCMRSVGRRHLMQLTLLAEGQLTKEAEKAEAGYELPEDGG